VILVDTSIWVDHLRAGDSELVRRLGAREVLIHPFVIGEIALGNLAQRQLILGSMARLPHAVVATDDEVMRLIDDEPLHGQGIGYVDAHLLASCRLSRCRLRTRDKRLSLIASAMKLAA